MGHRNTVNSRTNQIEPALVQSWFQNLDLQCVLNRPFDHCLSTHLKSHNIEALRDILTIPPTQLRMLQVVSAFSTFTAGYATALSTHSAQGCVVPAQVPLLRGRSRHKSKTYLKRWTKAQKNITWYSKTLKDGRRRRRILPGTVKHRLC